MSRLLRFAFVLVALTLPVAAARAAEPVDLLLVLAADVSRSVDAQKFQLQREGYAAAISDRREFLNDSVNVYNIHVQRFPDLLLARALDYPVHAYLEIPDDKKRDLSLDFEAGAKPV